MAAQFFIVSPAVPSARPLHGRAVMAGEPDQTPSVTQDGFGARSLIVDPHHGRLERVDLTPALASPASEQAIRARAAHNNSLDVNPLCRVVRISRIGETLSIFSEAPDGVPLSELLAGLEFKTISLSSEELLELSSSIVTALATLHECLPTIAHGAVTPAHIVLQRDGSMPCRRCSGAANICGATLASPCRCRPARPVSISVVMCRSSVRSCSRSCRAEVCVETSIRRIRRAWRCR